MRMSLGTAAVARAVKNGSERCQRNLIGWKRGHVERGLWHGTHRIDVAQGVTRGHLPKLIGVVDDGCDQINGLNQCEAFVEREHTGIVTSLGANQDTWIVLILESTQ